MPSTVAADRYFEHEALLYRDLSEFGSSCESFIRDGLRAGEAVLVAVSAPKIELLRSALAGDASDVQFVNMAELNSNPARIIGVWHCFLDQRARYGPAGSIAPVRGIGEPIGPGQHSDVLQECQLHESLLNIAIDKHVPLKLRCPYDVTLLPVEVITEAQRSHPVLVIDEQPQTSQSYADDGHLELFARPPSPAPTPDAEWGFDHGSLAELRTSVHRLLSQSNLSTAAIEDLGLALHELATNSVRHGGGCGILKIWRHEGALICEVTDRGVIDNPLVGRIPPDVSGEGGRGVWIANQLCDLVQIRSTPAGSGIRVTTWLPGQHP